MRPVTDSEIRTAFVNCSKGEARRLNIPRDLADRPWDDLDFLGWRDPAAPERAYLVTDTGDRLVGVALRKSTASATHLRRSMCSLCLTTHSGDGVSLLTARRAGQGGQQGNSVGAYMCTDLACSLYLRGRKPVEAGGRLQESLTEEEKAARLAANLGSFLDKVLNRPRAFT